MPFAPANDLPPNPDVRIFFSGLMLIQPNSTGSNCEVFVNRSAIDHVLTIEVREKNPPKPDIIKMRHAGPLPHALPPPDAPNDPFIYGMRIRVQKTPKGVKAFHKSGDDQSLSKAINLQGADFHDGNAGKVDQLGGRPSILINDGVFYAAALTDPSKLEVTLKKRKPPTAPAIKTLGAFATLIGTNIYLDNGDSVVIEWRPEGIPERLVLEKPTGGVSYEIYVINDPLFETNSLEFPPHDEFVEYYKILPDIDTADQLTLAFKDLSSSPGSPAPSPDPDRGSTKTPCMSVILDP